MIDYKAKIRKLLALAESDNENEAKAALLKAKELMMEHKLSEGDFNKKDSNVKRLITNYSYTKRGEIWIGALAMILGENYCCRVAVTKGQREQKGTVMFVGFEDDVDLCNEIFSYAVDTIRSLSKQYLKQKGRTSSTKYNNIIMRSYAIGFVEGIRSAYEEQKKDHEKDWGLVLVRAKEVDEACTDFRKDNYRGKGTAINAGSHSAGFEEGSKFNPKKLLK